MKKCPTCNNTIAFDAEFCPFDGDKLTTLYKCEHCGMDLQPIFKYCFKCGKPVEVKAP